MSEFFVASPKAKNSMFASPGSGRAVGWRVLGYGALAVSFYTIVVAAWLRPDFNRTELPDWKPALALADAAWERGDVYQARYLYLQVERIASWKQDWQGLVAAACGFKKLDGLPTRYSKSYASLIRATIVAEEKQSRQGMTAIAKAFSLMGQHQAAALFLARIPRDWPIEKNEPLDFPLRNC